MTTPPPSATSAGTAGTPSPSDQRCPSCGAESPGRFCSSCGTALAGAVCATCDAPMTAGARFCHRCGAAAGAARGASSRGLAATIPWAVAALALVCMIALVAGQRFGARNAGTGTVDVLDGANGQGSTVITAPGGGAAGGMPQAPDISQLSPAQRAERLYDRIMRESEAGNKEAVQTFMPMAVAAYEMLAPLDLDQRYDLGRIGEVAGDTALMRAQADTILRERPTHLLGLALAAKAARAGKDGAKVRELDKRLVAAETGERAAALPEYLLHKTDIDAALVAARSSK